ncbi:MAG TPA: LysR family transcriptional regulator [Chthoniobacterales bacterium]
MDLVKLRYFQTVAKTLHFRRAAALLNISQPPLSKSIKTLEDELGTLLFLRTRRQVELTPAGEVLLRRCERIFQELEDAKSEVKRYNRGEKGTIRIGCEDGTTFSVLPPLLQNFKRRYPAISCSVVTQPLSRQIKQLITGDLDAGIVPLPADHPELELIKFPSCSLVAAFAEHLPLASKADLQLKDLRHQPIVSLPEGEENLYSLILPYLKKRRIPVKLVPGAFDIATLLPMAASGLGIALIPQSFRECGPRGLVYREIVDSTLELSIGLAWKKRTRNAAVLNLVRVVRDMNL